MRGERSVTTILFTDIVGSTERAAELGDRVWRKLQAEHHARVRKELRRFGGREANTAGDAFLAAFTRPASALRCAHAIRESIRELGLDIRAQSVRTAEKEDPLDAQVGERVAGGLRQRVGVAEDDGQAVGESQRTAGQGVREVAAAGHDGRAIRVDAADIAAAETLGDLL